MPVFSRTDRGELRLTLSNGTEVLDGQTAATPAEAARIGIMMLASRDELNHGDTRGADEDAPLGGPGRRSLNLPLWSHMPNRQGCM
jgi:hypothetical protein